MSQNTRESLSALMDGESETLELRRVLKALPDDSDAADTWRRYHLARSLMQRERGVDTTTDLSAGIMARLSDEPVPVAVNSTGTTTAARPARTPRVSLMRGAGVAAAVSLMVITGVQYFGGTAGDGTGGTQHNVAGELADAGNGGVNVDVSLAQPASLAASSASVSGGSNMPMFEPTPFRLNGETQRSGLMTVSDSGFASPMGQADVSRQAAPMGSDQVRLLQSYLQQHAHGAAYSNSDSWLPLTRSSAISDALGR